MQIQVGAKKYVLSQAELEAVEWMAKVAAAGGKAALEMELDACLNETLDLCLTASCGEVLLNLRTTKIGLIPDFRMERIARVRLHVADAEIWSRTTMLKVEGMEGGWRLVLPAAPQKLSLERP